MTQMEKRKLREIANELSILSSSNHMKIQIQTHEASKFIYTHTYTQSPSSPTPCIHRHFSLSLPYMSRPKGLGQPVLGSWHHICVAELNFQDLCLSLIWKTLFFSPLQKLKTWSFAVIFRKRAIITTFSILEFLLLVIQVSRVCHNRGPVILSKLYVCWLQPWSSGPELTVLQTGKDGVKQMLVPRHFPLVSFQVLSFPLAYKWVETQVSF